jgi:glycerol-3-phosphate dehydrogenase
MNSVLPVKRVFCAGGGAFGTALALSLARKSPDAEIHLWVFDKKEADAIEAARENKIYLKGFALPPNVHFTSDYKQSLRQLTRDGAEQLDLVVITVPVQFLAAFLKSAGPSLPPGVPLVICSKGIEISTLRFPFEIALDALPSEAQRRCLCVLSGPSFASEVAKGLITAMTCGAKDIALARKVQRLVSSADGKIRVYASEDFMGMEICSAAKNVIAILTGAAEGYGVGLNARAAIVTRGLKEIGRLMRAKGSSGESLGGLSGVGDLSMTASSRESRNYQVGYRIGKGETYAQIKPTMKAVAEGVPTAKALYLLCEKLGVQMPLCACVYKLIYEGKPVEEIVGDLIGKPLTDELRSFPLPHHDHDHGKVKPSKL